MIKKVTKKSPKEKEETPDFQSELFISFLEKAKRLGALTYQEVTEFIQRHHLSEKEARELLKHLEKEQIEVLYEENVDATISDVTDFEKDEEQSRDTEIKKKYDGSLFGIAPDEEEESDEADQEEFEDEQEAVIRETAATAQITDGVKCYLRDIGKIPLLNKKTEMVIAEMIASGKRESVEALSQFPFVHKELTSIAEKLDTRHYSIF